MGGGGSDPTDVFDLVSDSTRVAILRALASAYSAAPTDPWLAYGELKDAAGIRDNGNFNYHLDRLDDLVVKGPSGYRISRIGMEVVSTVASGVLDPDWTWGPVDAPGECFHCGDSLQLRYEDGNLRLTCGRDDHALALSVPPSLLESNPEGAAIERIAFTQYQWVAMTRRGICSECHGPVDGGVERASDDADHYDYRGHCRRCGFHHGMPVGTSLLGHPTVNSFYYDHGVDVRTTPFWTLDWCAPGHETVASTDPLRLRVDVRHGGEMLSLTVDEEGSVVATTRSPARVR